MSAIRRRSSLAAGLIPVLLVVFPLHDVPVRAVEAAPPAAGETARTTIVPSPSATSIRPPAAGTWRPTLLPPNDLTDPPQRYRNAEGGACVGMSAITHGLWAAPIEDFTLSDADAAALFIRNMLPEPFRGGERLPNHPLPGWILVDGKVRSLTSEIALVRIAEIIQNHLQPGGGKTKSPELVRRSHREVLDYPNRIQSVAHLRQQVAAAGGRLVVGAVGFNEQLTESTGHAFVLTLDESGDVFVWDPNSRMAADAPGSGLLVPLKYDLVDNDRFTAVRYEIELPDRTPQARRFQFLFPIETFVPEDKIPSLPRRK